MIKTELEKNLNYAACRLTVAFVWFYHGLVPKLLGPDSQELAMNMAMGFDIHQAKQISLVAGILELVFALALIVLWKQRWPLILSILLTIGLLAFCVIFVPGTLTTAFNPVTINISVIVLSVVALRLHGKKDYV